MGFQTKVAASQAKAIEGDFASTHTTIFASAGEGCLLAGDRKVKVGNFAFLNEDGKVYGAKPGTGFNQPVFVHRQMNGTLERTEEGSLLIPEHRPVSAFVEGEFWARFEMGAKVGQRVFVSIVDGKVTAADEGATVGGAIETKFIIRTEAEAGELAKISSWGV